MINDSKQESCGTNVCSQTPIISLDEDDFEIINETFEFLYTGSCASLPCVLSHDSSEVSQRRELTDDDILNELAMSLQDVDFDFFNTGGCAAAILDLLLVQ